MTAITPADAEAQLPGWRHVDDSLEVGVTAKDFKAAIAFLNAVAELAETQQHHPDIDLRYNRIRMRVMSHDVGTLTERDIKFAKAADVLISKHELTRELSRLTRIQIAIDALSIGSVKPFWLALLGYKDAGDDWIRDPAGVLPPVWFQQMDALRPERSTTHLDVYVPADRAASRIQAALAAGGTLVTDAHAPSFWVLADAEGNEACVCTWQDREATN